MTSGTGGGPAGRAGDVPHPGVRLVGGRYRLIAPLGVGGMGTVWRAEDEVLGRHVAVKEVVFPHHLSAEERETLRERTRREARAAARLDHPSAVTVYDVVEEDGQPWLVLELVEARTLAETVRDLGPLSPARTAEVGLAVLGALEAAHARGIVHRDVKPSNVLLGEGGRVVLTDFGIATSTGDASITSTGLLLGSPSYISPERARGAAPGPASDLWALGATLFTAVEGRAPYDKGEPLPTMTAVVTGDREPYLAAGPLVPVLDGLLEADPTRRWTAVTARTQLSLLAARADAQATTALPLAGIPRPARDGDGAERTAALSLSPEPQRVPEVRTSRPAPVPPGTLRRGRRTRTAALTGLTVVVLGAASAGVLLLDGSGEQLTPGSAPSAAAVPEPGVQPGAVPAGWTTHRGGPGWTAATPASYATSSYNGAPQYKDPDSRRTLRVSTGTARPDAVADRRAAAEAFSSRFPSYAEIGIRAVDYRGAEAADWEFTYSDGGADLHVLNRVFVSDGVGYSLFFQTRQQDWDAAQQDLEGVLSSFLPA